MSTPSRHDPESSTERLTSPMATRGVPAPIETVPDQIGAYRIDRTFEPVRGGMGTVYRAHNVPALGGFVALKVMRDTGDEPEAVAMFEAEAMKANKARHPNVVQMVFAGSFVDGDKIRPYYVMEWIDDAVMLTDERLLQGLDLRRRVDLLLEVCSAVDHGHRHGVIHGDLKPSNVVVSNWQVQSRLKVLDFGLARAMQGWKPETLPVAGGTPRYMSPEVFARGGRDPDVRSDVYALGVMMREMLLPAWERKRHWMVDGRLRRIVDKAAAALPEQRFESAREVQSALERWRSAVMPRVRGAWGAWAARRPVLAAAAIGLGATFVGAGLFDVPLDHTPLRSALSQSITVTMPRASELTNVRVIRLTDDRADEAFAAAGVAPEVRTRAMSGRLVWAKVLDRLSQTQPKGVCLDLYFFNPSDQAVVFDEALGAAIDRVTAAKTPVTLALPTWEVGDGAARPSRDLYNRPGVVFGTTSAFPTDMMLTVPLAVRRSGSSEFVPSFALLTAFQSWFPGRSANIEFNAITSELVLSPRAGSLLDPAPQRDRPPVRLRGAALTRGRTDAGIRPDDDIVFLPMNTAPDSAFAPATLDAAEVLTMPLERLLGAVHGRLLLLADNRLGLDTLAGIGRSNDHGCFIQAAAIDHLVSQSQPILPPAWASILASCAAGLASIGATIGAARALGGSGRRWRIVGICVGVGLGASLAVWGLSLLVLHWADVLVHPLGSMCAAAFAGVGALLHPQVHGAQRST